LAISERFSDVTVDIVHRECFPLTFHLCNHVRTGNVQLRVFGTTIKN
jgi:hypothetical protein